LDDLGAEAERGGVAMVRSPLAGRRRTKNVEKPSEKAPEYR